MLLPNTLEPSINTLCVSSLFSRVVPSRVKREYRVVTRHPHTSVTSLLVRHSLVATST